MMRKMLVLFVLAVLAIVAAPVEAQNRSPYYNPLIDAINGTDCRYTNACGGRYNQQRYNPYGYYDPAYIQQMMSLPEGLAACSVDFSTGRVVSCRPVVKEVGAIQAYLQNPDGMFGTIHVEKGKLHFRPFDDTNQRLGRGGATAISTTGGAVAGAVFGGKKGAVIGGGTGALVGWLASRKFNRHDNCLIIEPTVAQSGGLAPSEAVPVSYQEQVPLVQPDKQEAGPESKLFWNRFENATVKVYDGSTEIVELGPGDHKEKAVRLGARIWAAARLENIKNDKEEWIPLQSGRGMDKLPEEAGWLFGNPNSRPSLE